MSNVRRASLKRDSVLRWHATDVRPGEFAVVDSVRDVELGGITKTIVFFFRKGMSGYSCFDGLPLNDFMRFVSDPCPGPSIYAQALALSRDGA
jgi:hypothetical protein